MKRIASLGIGLLLVATACIKPNFKKEIKQVDSLLVELDTVKLKLDSINYDNVIKVDKTTKDILKTLHSYYDTRGEELSKEDGIEFGRFKAIKKGLKNFNKRYENVTKEFHFTYGQLNNLKTDMENGSIEKEQGETYYNAEKIAVEILEKEMSSLLDNVKFSQSRYAQMHEDIKLRMEKVGIADSIAW